jgi:hypothetical protein
MVGLSRLTFCLALTCCIVAGPVAWAQDPPPTPPGATFEGTIFVGDANGDSDGAALVPNNDWMPLVTFTLTGEVDEDLGTAERVLQSLTVNIVPDPVDGRPWGAERLLPRGDDFLEFGMFFDVPDGDDHPILLDGPDQLMFTWDATGAPYTSNDASGSLEYTFDFYNNGYVTNPVYDPAVWPVAGPADSEPTPGFRYIIAFRTSSVFRSGTAFSATIPGGGQLMVDPNLGIPPVDPDTGEPVDTYPEDDIAEDEAYSSSFTVYDATGDRNVDNPGGTFEVDLGGHSNDWVHPLHLYTTPSEFIRPRFDLPGNLIDVVSGEWMFIRELIPLEQWTAAVAINLHGAPAPVIDSVTRNQLRVAGGALLQEVNLILTDIGADPFGPPGNGGFDPRFGLERMTGTVLFDGAGPTLNPVGDEVSFNGAWLYHDTNNSARFEPPIKTNNAGVNLQDLPMLPDSAFFGWEYIPFPPGGGDPWWKIRLGTSGFGHGPNGPSVLELQPDVNADLAAYTADYYAVVKADSGFQDASLLPGDGTGLQPGADFRAFVEPRRFNPASGSQTGGIHVDSMSMPVFDFETLTPWQDDPIWDFPHPGEPWWAQRTTNPTTSKPLRNTFEVHDLVSTYSSRSEFAKTSDIFYANSIAGIGWGFDPAVEPSRTNFDTWLDPFRFTQSQFFDFHSVGTYTYFEQFISTLGGVPIVTEDDTGQWQFSYETTPFFDPTFDVLPFGPRSPFYSPPNIAAQPSLPGYSTWLPNQVPASALPVGRYPSAADWPAADRAARMLTQRTDGDSPLTALLGFNFVGIDDPVANRVSPMSLEQFTVAFYGEDFTPDDFRPVDATGVSLASGVLLFEDADADGVFAGDFGGDLPVALRDLAWADESEHSDIDGDGLADDMNGDGEVDEDDYAWVLRITPDGRWRLPTNDEVTGGGLGTLGAKTLAAAKSTIDKPDYWTESPVQIDLDELKAARAAELAEKELPDGGSVGDDLFLVVGTSSTVKRFETFKAIIPATLPSRVASEREASIKFFPRQDFRPSALAASSPEENPVQDWYGHSELQVNVPVAIIDLTSSGQSIGPESEPQPILGIDMWTARGEEGIADYGADGTGEEGMFTVPGAGWAPDSLTGYFLIDSGFEAYEIVGNGVDGTGNDFLTLLSGTPREGQWFIAIDPSFLEYLVVEFYDTGDDGQFDFREDLLPLDIDQTKSGVALYRDNTYSTANRVGLFDPGVDIPLDLDFAPFRIGVAGEPGVQLKFVFSSPGTDDVPTPGLPRGLENQPRRRQWVPEFSGKPGEEIADPALRALAGLFSGSEILVVIRTSDRIEAGDDFSAGIVSWGPATPSAPDPDTFPPPPFAPQDEFDKFQEFPWGSQAIGLVTMFREPPDATGFRFLRSSVAKNEQSNVILATAISVNPSDVAISGASPSLLPLLVGAGGTNVTIAGVNFGSAPQVFFNATLAEIISSSDGEIEVRIPAGTAFEVGVDTVVVRVINTETGKSASRSDLFEVRDGDLPDAPTITSISPDRGTSAVFPVVITGTGFASPTVFFGTTQMPVRPGATATRIEVDFPAGGLAQTGFLDVRVVVQRDGFILEASSLGGFNYENLPVTTRPCFIATAAYGGGQEWQLSTLREFRDGVLLQSSLGTAFVNTYYNVSPAMADHVARSPWLSALVRLALTPVAWAIHHPAMALVLMGGGIVIMDRVARRRRSAFSIG